MFPLMIRVIKTRDGKIYSGELGDFEEHGNVVILKGFLSIFQQRIHAENIIEDYTCLSKTCYFLLFLLGGSILFIGLFATGITENFKITNVTHIEKPIYPTMRG